MIRSSTVTLSSLFLSFALLACVHDEHGHPLPAAKQEPEPESISRAVTVWSADHEIFAEHDLPLPGVPAGYAMHVTNLRDGAPQTEGDLRMRFRRGAETVEARSAAPARPGIHLGDFSLPEEGEWSWEVMVGGETITMPAVLVSADVASRNQLAGSWEETGGVTMLKEQQWPIRLITALALERDMAERVEVLVKVASPPGCDTVLRAPISGFINGHSPRPWPQIGERLDQVAVVGHIQAFIAGADAAALRAWEIELATALRESEQGRITAESNVAVARENHAHAVRQERRQSELLRSESAAPREHEVAMYALNVAIAELAASEAALEAWRLSEERLANRTSSESGSDPWRVEIFPARLGDVVEVYAAPGDWVEAGAPLLRVVDDSRLLLTAMAPLAHGLLPGATLRIALPDGGTLQLPGPAGRLLFGAAPADPATRTRPLVFECAASGGMISGSVIRGALTISAPRRALTVPVSAIVDEDGTPAVYVHARGETFVRRIVRTGARDGAWVEVLEGLAAGERVVVDGAPVVRLVSLSGVIPEHRH